MRLAFCFKTQTPKKKRAWGKKKKKNQNRERNEMTPSSPTDARCTSERKKLLGTAEQGLKHLFIAQCKARVPWLKGTQALQDCLTSVWAWGLMVRRTAVHCSSSHPKPWLESWMKLTGTSFYFLWETFALRANVFRRTFLWHASMTNNKSYLTLSKEIRCPKVVWDILSGKT